MRVKYMGSKSWLAPHVDRLLGDVAVLHSPFFGSRKLEHYLVRGVDAFEPVANLHRCYLRQDPVFLRSLLRLAGRKIDRRFYFSRLLPGTQRGRAGRRAACSLLRNSFSGKWGSFTQQRAASATASEKCDSAMQGRTGISTRSAQPSAPTSHIRRSSVHLLWHEKAGA